MSVQQRVSDYRRRMRERGYRPVQMWVPDVRAPELVHEAHRQARLVAQLDANGDDQAFVEAVSVDWGEE